MVYMMILLMFVPTIFITAITPYITRKTESFGVSIPEEIYRDKDLSEFRKKYAVRTTILGIIWLALSMLAGLFLNEDTWIIVFTIALFLFLFSSFMIYFDFHKRMKTIKAASNWKQTKKEAIIVDINFRNRKLIYSYGWFAIALVITVATFLVTVMYYDKIPSEIPMNYGLDGTVTNWAEKSYGSVFAWPLIQLFMLGLFIFINYTISRSRQQVDASNPEKSIMQNVIFRRRWSAFIIITGTAMVILFALIQFSLIIPINDQIILSFSLILTGAVLLGAIILTVITGQGGSRVQTTVGKQGELITRDEDRFWKLGMFYFNPEDPAIWVEKRFGSGWTVNLAKPLAWVFFLVILLVPILIAFLA